LTPIKEHRYEDKDEPVEVAVKNSTMLPLSKKNSAEGSAAEDSGSEYSSRLQRSDTMMSTMGRGFKDMSDRTTLAMLKNQSMFRDDELSSTANTKIKTLMQYCNKLGVSKHTFTSYIRNISIESQKNPGEERQSESKDEDSGLFEALGD
jgi:hypothetical protein